MGRNITPVVKYLLIINIAFLIIENFLHFNLAEYFGFRYFGSGHFQPFQVITYMFLHADFWHLLSNMFGLFFLGPLLEQMLGSKRFLIFYMVAGVGAGILFASVNYTENYIFKSKVNNYLDDPTPQNLVYFTDDYTPYLTEWSLNFIHEEFPKNPDNADNITKSKNLVQTIFNKLTARGVMVGASGAIFGIVLAFGFLFPNLELMLLFPPIPIKAKYFALFYGLYSVYSLLENRPDDNVAHLAHLGGMLFGYLMIKYWKMKPYM